MRKIKVFFTVLAVLLSTVAFAQNVKVTGTVKDSETGEAIPFAAIQVKGTTTGAATDVNGAYTMTVPANATLVFSSVGYINEEVAIAGKTTINVSLKPDNEALEGTIVIGYGSAKKVGSVVGSVTTVKSDIVKNAPSSSALDQLQGQVAGLAVTTTGGVAGDNNVSMTLHGVGSLGASSTPLYIIDGVPSSSGSIMAMNPNDILSISILKDASATSIYGSRAANGVVYVTTKQGSYDSRSKVTARSQYGISTLANTAIYGNMMSSDELMDFWVRAGIHTDSYIKANFTDKGYTANTEWYKVMQQMDNPQYQNDVTIEGGGSKVAYMMSASQFHQRGTTIGNYYDRYTVRSNVQGHHKDWLKVGMNINFSMEETQQNGNWGDSGSVSNNTNGGLSFLLIPMWPAVDPETGERPELRFSSGRVTPWHYMETNPDVYRVFSLMGSGYIEIEPVRNLIFRSQVGTDSSLSLNTWATKKAYVSSGGVGYKGQSSGFAYNNTITNTVEYSWSIANDHKFSVLAGQEGVDYDYSYFYATSSGQTDDRLLILQNGLQTKFNVSESRSEYKFLSFFGHADYNYKSKYNFDFTIRDDASSRFGANNRHAQFWSAGILWNAKKEDFLKNASFLNDLKLKVSYGTQGNAGIGNYASLSTIGSSSKYQEATSMVLSSPGNPDLTWEKQGLFTTSLSGRVFNALDFEFEVYNRNTTSMLMSVPYPYTSGFSSATSNVGSLSNTGVDVTLGLDILRGRDYFFRVNTTFNYNKQIVKELFQGRDRWEIANTGVAYKVGEPVMFYYPIYAGVDPEDGAPTWYLPAVDEKTGDILPDICTMDPTRTTKVFDTAALTQNTGHKRYAPINGGFGLSAGWKGFSVAADFAYTLGKYLVNNDEYFYANPYNFSTMNTYKGVSDFWTPDNKDAKWPAWNKGYTMEFDTHLLENASFLRLKSVQAGYTLPKSLLGDQKFFDGLRLTFTGRNLLTATKYTGPDPEVNSNLTYGKTGATKQYLVGLEITF